MEHCCSAINSVYKKRVCLQGGKEHRNLRLSQLKRVHDPKKYELASKNRTGGLAQLQVTNKSVSIFSVPEAGSTL